MEMEVIAGMGTLRVPSSAVSWIMGFCLLQAVTRSCHKSPCLRTPLSSQVSGALGLVQERLQPRICHVGQHRESQ